MNRRNRQPFLNPPLDKCLEEFVDSLKGFLAGIAPRYRFLDIGTVRLVCLAPILVFVNLDNNFKNVTCQ